MMRTVRKKVWDPFVRIFHWSLALGFSLNAFLIDGENHLHRWLGYLVAALVLSRILWGFVGTGYARFESFRPSIRDSLEQMRDILVGGKTVHFGHTPLGAMMIYNLLLAILVICLSGHLMTTDMFWGEEWPEALHEAAVIWAEISMSIHIAAVIFESFRTRVNLPAAMLNGYKTLPADCADMEGRDDN